jgi:hypothetical protein
MTAGIPNLEALIERLEQATEEAREATRGAHSAIKALRQAEQGAIAARRELEEAAISAVEERLGQLITEGLQEFRDGYRRVMEKHDDRIGERFERLANRAMYGNAQGKGVNIFDRLREQALLWDKIITEQSTGLPAIKARPKSWP